MAFWRRRREAEPEVTTEPAAPGSTRPGADFTGGARAVASPPRTHPKASKSKRSDGDALGGAALEPPIATPAEPAPTPAYAPFDPTAFLAVVPEGSLETGLEKTRTGLVTQLRGYLGNADGPQWDEVEETLIAGDVGAALSIDLVERARKRREPGGPEAAIRAELAALLVDRDVDWQPRSAVEGGPAVVLVVGVNGTGKTTTIGKLAARYAAAGRSVILAAADTFRAAAIDQLRIWADRAEVPMIAHAPGADPGAVVYDALDAAVARGADLVIADTAGRLHTKSNLMDELTKVRRIIDKRLPGRGARNPVRARCDDRPERPRPGQCLPRGRRADRDRPDQARFDGQGRHRLRHRAFARRPGPLRRGGGGGRRPAPVRPGRLCGRAIRLTRRSLRSPDPAGYATGLDPRTSSEVVVANRCIPRATTPVQPV